ncbi:MAG: ribonuclease P protein component [bacterium]
MEHRIKVGYKILKIFSLNSKEMEFFLTKCNPDILRVYKLQNLKIKVKIFVQSNALPCIKYAIVVSKKVGKAFLRNLIRRKIRNSIIYFFSNWSFCLLKKADVCYNFIFIVKKV